MKPFKDDMKLHSILILTASILAGFCMVSCHKDDEETLPYLTGSPDLTLPAYGAPGDSFSFSASGVTDDDGKEPDGYYWYASPIKPAKDTSKTYSITLTDTLCTVTVTCGAYKDGYYSTSTSKSITIVRGGHENGSITGLEFDEEKDFKFTDSRDGREYWCTTIGDKDWFKENLAFTGAGVAMENCPAAAGVFGMFYTWSEAKTACPEGWRVSSLQDWADAVSAITGKSFKAKEKMYSIAGEFMGDLYFNGAKMWEYWPDVKITGTSELSVMPAGYASILSNGRGDFSSLNEYAVLWTGDEKDEDQGYYRYIYMEQPDILIGSAGKDSFGASVRCVRDHIE